MFQRLENGRLIRLDDIRFVQVGDRIINTDAIVEVKITAARERRVLSDEEVAEYDYPRDNVLPARELRVDVVTTATTSSYDDGGDYPEFRHTDFHPYTITLLGEEAQALLDLLTTVEPVGPVPPGGLD